MEQQKQTDAPENQILPKKKKVGSLGIVGYGVGLLYSLFLIIIYMSVDVKTSLALGETIGKIFWTALLGFVIAFVISKIKKSMDQLWNRTGIAIGILSLLFTLSLLSGLGVKKI